MNKMFWKNKRVLVTGHEGFLGSNLTLALAGCGARVTGVDILTDRKHSLFTEHDRSRFHTVKGSVANYKLMQRLLRSRRIEYVFHLAAEAIVGRCNEYPLACFESNIEGTWKLLEACRQYGKLKAIVVASSDKAYGSHKSLPYKENTPLVGDHPYDVSKSCADLIAYAYYHTYNLPVSVTRCGNIYGPGDLNYSRIVPDAIRCAIGNKTLLIRSDGKFTRDYVFVRDIVNGYLLIAEKMKSKNLQGQAFNFSDENPVSVVEFLKLINKTCGCPVKYRVLDQAKYEIKHQYLESKKARRMLGWRPQYTISGGLRETVGWYKANAGRK